MLNKNTWALIGGPLLAVVTAAGMHYSGWDDKAFWTGR